MIIENNKTDRILIKTGAKSITPIEEDSDPQKLFYSICKAIREGGYDPVSQIVGYLVSEDPAHVTNYKNARSLIGRIDRDDLLIAMVKSYIESLEKEFDENE